MGKDGLTREREEERGDMSSNTERTGKGERGREREGGGEEGDSDGRREGEQEKQREGRMGHGKIRK